MESNFHGAHIAFYDLKSVNRDSVLKGDVVGILHQSLHLNGTTLAEEKRAWFGWKGQSFLRRMAFLLCNAPGTAKDIDLEPFLNALRFFLAEKIGKNRSIFASMCF